MAKNTLKILLAGNKNFVDGTPMAMNKCLTTLQKYAHRQAPHAIVLCCSDSRVVFLIGAEQSIVTILRALLWAPIL